VSAITGTTTNTDSTSLPVGTSPGDCGLADTPTTGSTGFTANQIANAATIVAIGKQLGVPEQGWVVAIAAALQESELRDVPFGDRDSLGLFQQRPSQGWGTPAQILDPTYAATQFYRHLLAVSGWQQMSINDAAQAVQRSGYPAAYARHEPTAREIVAVVGGALCSASSSSSSSSPAMPVAPHAVR
jgi:hypothetical protein